MLHIWDDSKDFDIKFPMLLDLICLTSIPQFLLFFLLRFSQHTMILISIKINEFHTYEG